MAHLHYLVQEASNITSSTTDVYYNDGDGHGDGDTMSSLLDFDPQQFVQTHLNTIGIFGFDDKAKAGCVQDVAISATGRQYVHTIVAEGQAPSASDHDFNTQLLIPPVTHRMNIKSGAGDSLCSGGEEGGG